MDDVVEAEMPEEWRPFVCVQKDLQLQMRSLGVEVGKTGRGYFLAVYNRPDERVMQFGCVAANITVAFLDAIIKQLLEDDPTGFACMVLLNAINKVGGPADGR